MPGSEAGKGTEGNRESLQMKWVRGGSEGSAKALGQEQTCGEGEGYRGGWGRAGRHNKGTSMAWLNDQGTGQGRSHGQEVWVWGSPRNLPDKKGAPSPKA